MQIWDFHHQIDFKILNTFEKDTRFTSTGESRVLQAPTISNPMGPALQIFAAGRLNSKQPSGIFKSGASAGF